MTTTVTGIFDDRIEASAAVEELKAAGVPEAEISIVTNKVDGQGAQRDAGDATSNNSMSGTGATDGAAIGGVLGGGAGLLAGLGAFTIPGIGPALGVGWLVTTAIGAVVGASGGGIIGALIGAGVNEDDAKVYVEKIRSGGTLVSARVPDGDVAKTEAVMKKYNGLNREKTVVVVERPVVVDRPVIIATGRPATPAATPPAPATPAE